LRNRENEGTFKQKRAVKFKGMDLIHRIRIGRLGFNAAGVGAVDRYVRFDRQAWDDRGRWMAIERPRSSASGKRRDAAGGGASCGDATPVSGGENAGQHRDAPEATGSSPGHRARMRELDRGIPRRQRRGAEAHGEPRRRWNSGEPARARWCTGSTSSGTGGFLTSRRIYGVAQRRPNDGGGTGSWRRRGPRRRWR
jgi:hypothetical protein